jgi:hypothetical protein
MPAIEIAASVLEQWKQKEYGSWEDAGCPETLTHVYPILLQRRSRVRWDTPEQLKLLIASAGYHRGAWDPEEHFWMEAMNRMYFKLLHKQEIAAREENPLPERRTGRKRT